MSLTRIGTYKKDGTYHEVTVSNDATYETVATKAAEVIGLDCSPPDEILCLFRSDGTLIPAEKLVTGFGVVEWTIGRYLKQLKKTPAQVKFGVGIKFSVRLITF